MMDFEFATANRIIFGDGQANQLLEYLSAFEAKRVLLVVGGKPQRWDSLVQPLKNAGISIQQVSVSSEPELLDLKESVKVCRKAGCDLVIGIGGGSVMDLAKAVAALATNPEPLEDYFEVIGSGKALTQEPLPSVLLPTTAGTGAEVTKNAVINLTEHRVKVSIRHPRMLPDIAIVDPELTYTLPADVTAHCGLDALTQLIESFVSNKANVITDALCREAIPKVAKALPIVFRESLDRQARADLSLGSLFSGLALANSKLGAVHGIAGPLGGMISIPHGAVCAILLPAVFEVNAREVKVKQLFSSQSRFDEIAAMLCGAQDSTPADAIRWLHERNQEFKIPKLGDYGFQPQMMAELIEKSSCSSSMQGNPVKLTDDHLQEILKKVS